MGAERVAVTVVGDRMALWWPGGSEAGPTPDVVLRIRALEAADRPRWVWWSAAAAARPAVSARVHLARCWDVAEAHRLLVGGWRADPGVAWATAHGLDPAAAPAAPREDLFAFAADAASEGAQDEDDLTTATGHLRGDAVHGDWVSSDARLVAWGRAAYETAERQADALAAVGPRAVGTAHSESAAALFCLELERDGLPVDRAVAEALIAEAAGPRADDDARAGDIRAARDALVLRHVPGREHTDLRNPGQIRELLAGVGVDVPNTRAWVLEPYRHTHPVVEALLTWRKAERIATTYGYGWLDTHVSGDDRLRGGWTACDGAAGRMTAQNGLHNLPAVLRPAVAAEPGHVFVRADLGQIEPRVLAAVTGDERFAAATRADDLYAPVSAALGVERSVAKVAVLAAMYGQRSGAAGAALKDLERAYPTAMGHLDRAYAAGVARQDVRTFGGRLIPLHRALGDTPTGADPATDGARGRFARNALIQGAAAELFKAWAATVRATTRQLGAQIVLCLHDELLIHVAEDHADEVTSAVVQALDDAARRWLGGEQVRFVADVSVIRRWSDAKD